MISSSLQANIEKDIMIGGSDRRNHLIEVVGMSCRFPGGVENLDSFWDFIREKKNSFSPELFQRWDLCNQQYDHDVTEEHKGALYGSLLDNIEAFDAPFFDISPTQAKLLDPHVRHTLEKVVHALEDAEIPFDDLSGSQTGTFVGQWESDLYGRTASSSLPPSPSKNFENPYYGTGRK